jgi:hypothetical protein
MAVMPGKPRHAVLAAGIEAHVLHGVDQVGLVGELGVVQRRHVAQVDQPAGHPVGQHDDVAIDALVPLERLVDLGEKLVVVVDVFGVFGLDPGGLLEVRHGLLVDVKRPVGDAEGLAAAGRRGGGRVAGRGFGAFLAAAARGEQAVPQHQTACAQRGPPDETPSGERVAEKRVQLGVALVGLSSTHG